MAENTGKRIDREAARSIVEPALYALYLLAFGLFAFLVFHYDSSLPWRIAVVAIGTIVVYRIFERSNFVQALSDRAARNGIAQAPISVILGAARGIRAAFVRLVTASPFRRLARPALALFAPLALPLAIVLTAALTYRLAAFPALIARGAGASGFELLVLLADWLLFGPSYGLVGAAAPLITLLLLLRRRRSSLGIAALLHGVALVGAALAFALGRFRVDFGMLVPVPDTLALFHPLYAMPQAGLWPLHGIEMLVSVLALYLIMRPQVRRHYRFPKPEEPGAAVIAFGVVVVYLKTLRVGSRFLRALSDRANRADVTGAAISKLLGAAEWTRAAYIRLRAIPPVRWLARLALLLAFVLAVAIAGWPQPQP